MIDIFSLLICLEQSADKTTLRQLSRIVLAMLTMTGRVTMLGISRWTEKGGSYRTVQRFFAKTLPWASLLWLFFRHQILRSDVPSLLSYQRSTVAGTPGTGVLGGQKQ